MISTLHAVSKLSKGFIRQSNYRQLRSLYVASGLNYLRLQTDLGNHN